MDDRTYPVTPVTHDALRAENERLRAELGQCASENNQLTENAAELGKALDAVIAERDAAHREVDAQTLKANSFRSELHRYVVHARELKEMLDISVAERDALRDELGHCVSENNQLTEHIAELRAELDAMRRAHSVIAARMDAMGC